MQAKTKLPKLYVNEGDTVVINFSAYAVLADARERVKAVILEIRPQYARVNDGATPQKPLVRFRDLSTGEQMWVSMDFVTSIVERSKTPHRPKNIFASPLYRPVSRESRSVLVGTLHYLVAHSLAGLNAEFSRPLDERKIQDLFDKQRPGFLGHGDYREVRVHEKPFRAWARRNAPKMLATVKSMVEEHTQLEKEYEENYWRRIEEEDNDFFSWD